MNILVPGGGDSELLARFALRTAVAGMISPVSRVWLYLHELDILSETSVMCLSQGSPASPPLRGEIHYVKFYECCLSLGPVPAVFVDTRRWYFETLEILY